MLAINIFIVLFAGGLNVMNIFLSSEELLFGVRISRQERLTPEINEIRMNRGSKKNVPLLLYAHFTKVSWSLSKRNPAKNQAGA